MSGTQHGNHALSARELEDLLAEALANPKIKKRLARPFTLVTDFDISLLGSSSIGGANVYLDRNLRYRNWPYAVLPVKSAKLDVKPGLIRHERLEQALEDELGWPYASLAHPVAQHWEDQDYKRRGFDPQDVERMFDPYVKFDEKKKIIKSPTDLDMRPLLSPPKSTEIIAHIKKVAQKEKRTHESVGYVEKSRIPNQSCGRCKMFVEPMYGGPACTIVQDDINQAGWCRRFFRGVLGKTDDT